jgi:hypothetical protein
MYGTPRRPTIARVAFLSPDAQTNVRSTLFATGANVVGTGVSKAIPRLTSVEPLVWRD